MEETFPYENREQLYNFLIEDFGFIKQEENYSAQSFGNYYILLYSNVFFLRYIQDRLFLTIEIASHSDPSHWYDLSFIKNFIYRPDNINSDDQPISVKKRIEDLNNFLKNDFELISDLFDKENFQNTQKKIDKLLRQQFDQRFPGAIQQ
jgi:hypothetical protein